MLKKEQELLLDLCRKSIKTQFSHEPLDVSQEIKKKFGKKQGVFVSLHIKQALRGCIGFIEPIYPLWDAITRAARFAAFGDPRFLPLNELEFKQVCIEISVLSVPKQIKAKTPEEIAAKIKIGKHGLIVEKGRFNGLLLPQVFTEYKVDSVGALEMTCEKAGLPIDAWQDPDAKIYSFEADVFRQNP